MYNSLRWTKSLDDIYMNIKHYVSIYCVTFDPFLLNVTFNHMTIDILVDRGKQCTLTIVLFSSPMH